MTEISATVNFKCLKLNRRRCGDGGERLVVVDEGQRAIIVEVGLTAHAHFQTIFILTAFIAVRWVAHGKAEEVNCDECIPAPIYTADRGLK